tara:strand:- start:61 stop:189 length:129 start_codon:yes stop_codon:yes gene_type:complete
MDSKKLVTIVGKILIVTAGVLVAFQVQTYVAKSGVSEPAIAE